MSKTWVHITIIRGLKTNFFGSPRFFDIRPYECTHTVEAVHSDEVNIYYLADMY